MFQSLLHADIFQIYIFPIVDEQKNLKEEAMGFQSKEKLRTADYFFLMIFNKKADFVT